MNEYRVKVTIKNNLLLSAIEAAGYKTQRDFAIACGISQHELGLLLAMRQSPIHTHTGNFRRSARAIMEVLGACPNDLWTERQMFSGLLKNTSAICVSESVVSGMVNLHENSMRLPSPDEVMESKEAQAITNKLLSELTTIRADVAMRRAAGETLEEVARAHGLTRERIRQIECVALRKLTYAARVSGLRSKDLVGAQS